MREDDGSNRGRPGDHRRHEMRPHQPNLLSLGKTHGGVFTTVDDAIDAFGVNTLELTLANDLGGLESSSAGKDGGGDGSDDTPRGKQNGRVLGNELCALPPCNV